MARRLNDTAALADAPTHAGQHHSISTESIDNGYLVRESTCDPRTGAYTSSTTFSKSPPRVIPGRVAYGPRPDGPGRSLRDAVEYMTKG